MNRLPLLFLGIFFCLAFSWTGLVLIPHLTTGNLKPIAAEEGEHPMPGKVPGLAAQGQQEYMNLGCMYCHTQQVRTKGIGADAIRYGDRKSVPRDYIRDPRVQLGTMRTGPDLHNIGDRPNNADWHHKHLYNPQITSPGSIMPHFAYLYRVQEIGDKPSPDALDLPDAFAPPKGYEVVPTERANVLVAYLLSLKHSYPLPESPPFE